MNPYSYDNNVANVKLELEKKTSGFRHYRVWLKSALDTGYEENSYIEGEYYQPNTEGKAPLAVLVHGMGDYSVVPCRVIAGNLLKQGIASFVPYLSIHSRRLPEPMRKNMPYLSPDEWFQVYRTSVIDIRQIIDWASARKELDASRVSVLGISFGGFVSAITMGIDERIKAGIFIVTGGNANKISWASRSHGYRKRYPRSVTEHEEIQRKYADYLREVEEKGFENVTAPEISFLTDPLTFAGKLRGRPVLMINARKDKYIPVETVNEFWRACGEPEIKWFPSGHTSLWLWYPSIRRTINEFLKSY